tara:strand:+ start:237 stop:845 length:609 start_codon:yes stop_codon:yes gene_type:complete
MAIDQQGGADRVRTRELVAEIAAFDAAEARIQAERERLYADAYALAQEQTARLRDASTREREVPLRAMAAELAVAKRVSDRTMQTRLFEAHRTVTQFPAAWESWQAGRVSRAHVKVIVDTGAELADPGARESYERDVLDYAETTSPARVRSYAEQVAENLNSVDAGTSRRRRARSTHLGGGPPGWDVDARHDRTIRGGPRGL